MKFEKLFKLSGNQLKEAYKEALLNGKSLGLIMIRNVEGAVFGYQFNQREDENYLCFEFKLNKG